MLNSSALENFILLDFRCFWLVWGYPTIGGPLAPGAPPPTGPDSFVLTCKIFENVAASGFHSPPYEVHAPPYGKSWIRHCQHVNAVGWGLHVTPPAKVTLAYRTTPPSILTWQLQKPSQHQNTNN